MSNSKKILFSTDRFDVIEKDGKFGVEPLFLSVAVLPFVRDIKGLPVQLGLLREYNKIKSKYTDTVITGRVDGEDPDILATAQKKMLDVAGLDVQEPERWFYLGFITTHKMVNQDIPCFACDITGLNYESSDEGDVDDDSVKNPDSFSLVGVNKALDTDDCYIPSMFMKMFRYIFGHNADIKDQQDVVSDVDQSDILQILDINGVVGADRYEGGVIIHIKTAVDSDSILSRARSILGDDVKIKVEETTEIKPE